MTGERGAGLGAGAISGDGRYVAFLSRATNLTSGDTNNLADLVLSQIQFRGGDYVIYGNALTLTNSLVSTNLGGGNVLYPNLTLSNADISINVGAGANLVLGGGLGGTGERSARWQPSQGRSSPSVRAGRS